MYKGSTTRYCVLFGGNIISWKSKKQNVVARSFAKVEYRAIASLTCQLIWVKEFFQELYFCEFQPMKMYCDSQTFSPHCFQSSVPSEAKLVEIDCHFI